MREMGKCLYCGKEFRGKSRQKYCSLSCSTHHTIKKRNKDTKEERETNFKIKFEELNPTLEYVGGYVNSITKVRIRCRVCNDVFLLSPNCIRAKRRSVCVNCRDKKKEERETKIKLIKTIKYIIKLKENKQREIRDRNKDIEKEKKRIKICPECGKAFKSSRRKYCSSKCKRKVDNRQHELYHRVKSGVIDNSISLTKLIKRDNSICYICNKKVNTKVHNNHNKYPSIDHVFPLAKGGTHTWDNVRLAHRGCNTKKRDSLYLEVENKQIKMMI